MAKIDDEIANLKKEVVGIKNDLNQINFNVLRILSELSNFSGNVSSDSGGSSTDNVVRGVTAAVDLGPIEEKLEELTKSLITKEEIELLASKIDGITQERIREAEETIKRVTSFLQTGLEMVKIESSLADVKALLEETIVQNN